MKLRLTSSNVSPVRRITTCRYLGTRTPFFRLDHYHRFLFTLILNVPNSVHHVNGVPKRPLEGTVPYRRIRRTGDKRLHVLGVPGA